MTTNARPKSRAKTAYGLLSEIRRLIVDEPKRYNQRTVVYFGATGDRAPACGTVGCVAGWIYALKRRGAKRNRDGEDVIEFAEQTLGLDVGAMSRLVDGSAAGREPQTARHAKRGAAHIARFQKKYATQLKAKAV